MSVGAVIVAAGRGSRMGDEGSPKQYRRLGDKSILQMTINCFIAHEEIDRVIVVIHNDDRELYRQSVSSDKKLIEPVTGGESRQASCHAGIVALERAGMKTVLLHDAARPFVSSKTISNVVGAIAPRIGVLPASPVADTMKKMNDGVVQTLPRDGVYLAQTPQGFMVSDIVDAHSCAVAQGKEHAFTDDAAVAEWRGLDIKLVPGNRENFKITTFEDLEAAKQMISENGLADVRSATGYDTHTLGPGDGVILCGVHITHDRSLQGHSDADVGLHSLTDALLGLIGEGDIGSHFPPSDEKWKDAASDQFLSHAVRLVRSYGGTITNLDVTLICESPKVGPHRERMRARIADICQLQIERVSVKATTNERVGFIGRGEGIAALATATGIFGNI